MPDTVLPYLCMVHEVLSFCVLTKCDISFKTSSTNEKAETLQETEGLTMQKKIHGTPRIEKIKKKEFSLPSVKELAKQFTLQDTKEKSRTRNELGHKVETKQKERSLDGSTPAREPELDYSAIPVSEIISNLQQIKQTPVQTNKHVPYEQCRSKIQIEIGQKTNSDEEKKAGTGRFNGKEVHSLTARSISKEFREGLKNNSYQNVLLKINRTVGIGEKEQRDVVCTEEETSPTPSIDLKNMKKFWEEIIMANANTTKHK